MNQQQNYKRWLHKIVLNALKYRRVIILAGPRQCGKTTLTHQLPNQNTLYYTLDEATFLNSALLDPRAFVAHGDELMIIDEIQRAPNLLTAIKQDVDNNQQVGRFLLTGSADVRYLPNVTESLAGRVRKLHLRPLAVGEIHNTQPNFLNIAFTQQFNSLKYAADNKDSYLQYALKGGYPEAIRIENRKEAQRWYDDYITTLLEHDLRDIAQIKRQDQLQKLSQILAAWSSKFMNISTIATILGIAQQTVNSYITFFEMLYLVERVSPWANTDYDRVVKQEKIFMTDTGLMAALLNWNFENVRLDGEKNGKLMETFVFAQLAAIIDAQEDNYHLFHYRDREKREVDFIIENEAGSLLGIEVKAGTAINQDSFKHLKWFQANIAKNKDFVGIIFYTGDRALPFGKNFWAIPINALWS